MPSGDKSDACSVVSLYPLPRGEGGKEEEHWVDAMADTGATSWLAHSTDGGGHDRLAGAATCSEAEANIAKLDKADCGPTLTPILTVQH